MKELRDFILLATMFLLCSVALLASDGKTNPVKNMLKRFPGYHLLTLQERDSDTKAFLVQHSSIHDPSLIEADFDDDGHTDYAMLLKDEASRKTKLVVLLCAADDQCKNVYELDETGSAEFVYLSPVRMGSRVSETEAATGNYHISPAKLRATGVRVSYFEKGEVVLYWDRKLGKIQEVETGD